MSSTPRGSAAPWLWVLIGAAVFTQTGLNLLRPVTSYKLLAFGADAVAVGIATASYAVIPLVIAVTLGRLSDRMLRLRPLLAIGAAGLGLGGVGLALAPNLYAVIAASAVLGFGHLAFTIAGQSAIARYSGAARLDTGFGWFTAAYSVGQLIGPFLGGLIIGTSVGAARLGAVETALWVGAAIAAAGALFFVVPLPGSPQDLRAEPLGSAEDSAKPAGATAGPSVPPSQAGPTAGGEHPASGTEEPAGRPTMWGILRLPGIPVYMLAALSLLSMLDILTAFLPVVGEELGISPSVIGGLLALRAAASIVCRIGLPWRLRTVGRRPLMLWCLFGSAAALALPPFLLEGWPGTLGVVLAAVALVIGGFFLGIGQPLTMSAITQAVPGAWRGSALAVRLMGNRLGQVVMPTLAGLIAAPWGPAGAIWMTCALLAASGTATALQRR